MLQWLVGYLVDPLTMNMIHRKRKIPKKTPDKRQYIFVSFLALALLPQRCPSESNKIMLKPLAKRIRKSMQVNTNFKNQNLRTDLRWVAKRIRTSAHKSRKSKEVVNLTQLQLTCDQLVSTCVGWPNGFARPLASHASQKKS